MIPCTVSGSALLGRRSASMRTNCSAYSGLPPARSSSVACVSAGQRALAQRAMSSAVSSPDSGASERVAHSACRLPSRAPLEQLRPGGADDEQRHVARPVDEVVDEVEQAVVRPMEILEDEDEWALVGERLEEAPPGSERLPLASPPPVARLPDERAQMRDRPLGVFVEQLLDRTRRAFLGLLVVVGLEDAGLRLDHLAERPVADAFAVGQRASLPPGRQLPAALDRLEELVDETALADSRHADERDELRRACRRARSNASTSCSSSRSRPTSGVRSGVRSTPKRARASTTSQTGDRLLLALRLDRLRARGTRSYRAVARYVVSPTRMPLTGAADCRRAAVLTTSPATMPSPSSGRAPRETSA